MRLCNIPTLHCVSEPVVSSLSRSVGSHMNGNPDVVIVVIVNFCFVLEDYELLEMETCLTVLDNVSRDSKTVVNVGSPRHHAITL